MEIEDFFKVTPGMIDCFKSSYIEGNNESLQKVLIELKEKGCSQMQSVVILINEANFSLKEANSIILNSIAWNGKKESS